MTVPDVEVSFDEFINIYDVIQVPPGTALIVQNKGSSPAVIQNVASQPSSSSWDGMFIPQYAVWRVEAGSLGAWVKGNGPLAVEIL